MQGRFASSLLSSAFHQLVERRLERLGVRRTPTDHEDGVLAGNRADRLRQARAVDRFGQGLRITSVRFQHDQLIHTVMPPQVAGHRGFEVFEMVGRFIGRIWPPVSPIDRTFYESKVADIARQGRLRGFDALLPQQEPELLLTADRLSVDDLQDDVLFAADLAELLGILGRPKLNSQSLIVRALKELDS